MSTHLLLIGRNREVYAKAKQLGFKLSMVVPMPKLKTLGNLGIYDRIVGLPATASDEEWVAAARLIHRLDPVDAVGGFQETTQEQAAIIADALGLPFVSAATIRATRYKDEMRQRLSAAGLDTTASRRVTCADEIAAFGATHGYPLVLKPVDGRGSLGVSVIRSQTDIPAALAWFGAWAATHSMLVEQFLEGEEWSVEAFSERGRHRIVCITQKFKDPTTSVETGHCLPAPLGGEARAAIERYVSEVLTALGIEQGPSHTEVIVTPEGPRIVETHARLAGDSIVELIELVSGVDLDALWIRQAAGESVFAELPSRLERYAAIAFVTPRAVGTLERVEGVAEATDRPGVVRVEVLQDLGARLEGAYDSASRGACAIAMGESGAEAVTRARQATEQLRFVVSCTG